MNWFSRKGKRLNSANVQLGIEFAADGIAIIALQTNSANAPELVHCAWLDCRLSQIGVAEAASQIRMNLRMAGIHDVRCVLSLQPQHYQLHRMTRPDVPSSEMRQAIRWQLRDLVDYPLTEAVVDVFPVYSEKTDSNAAEIYVVTAQQQTLAAMVDCIAETELEIDCIEIPELGVSRLLERLSVKSDAELQSMLHVSGDHGLLTICQNSQFQLGREIHTSHDPKIGVRLLRSTLETASNNSSTAAGKTTSSKLWHLPSIASNSHWAAISNDPSLPTQRFEYADILSMPSDETADVQAKCLIALTAALRVAA